MKVVPLPGVDFTLIVPACCVMIFLTIGSPSPVPTFAFVVWNGSKMESISLMPGPLSVTWKQNWLSAGSNFVVSEISPVFCGTASMAFMMRFKMTSLILSVSSGIEPMVLSV